MFFFCSDAEYGGDASKLWPPAGVSIKEFKQAMKDPALHAVFDALEISAGAAKR